MKVERISIADAMRAYVTTVDVPRDVATSLTHFADQIGLRYEDEVHVEVCMAGTQGQHFHYRRFTAFSRDDLTLCGRKVRGDALDETADCPQCIQALSGSQEAA